ncbi:MAG: hypothetical protein JGK39_25755 [Microcoleus sp. PH2017_12_PCY_D_A]|uniref:hypothetical protein n=1 Tax=Microcoleus sp. PH2017_12_PCY_D_A TaxID=2798823 RepID=UPI001DBC8522|nr:hypothetical protein [Microcoleus sp. PH2017_12_PCY_D_A]MCC3481393.1 hypothetical protein [Microcoleus sp. PH2017_12_PCY_D_A]
MKTTKIGFGVNNYENFRIYIEADLEPDEDCTLALDFLRTRVADEIGFPQYYLDFWLITFPLLTFPILALLLQAFKFLKLILAMGMMIVMMVMMVIVLSQIHLKVNIF